MAYLEAKRTVAFLVFMAFYSAHCPSHWEGELGHCSLFHSLLLYPHWLFTFNEKKVKSSILPDSKAELGNLPEVTQANFKTVFPSSSALKGKSHYTVYRESILNSLRIQKDKHYTNWMLHLCKHWKLPRWCCNFLWDGIIAINLNCYILLQFIRWGSTLYVSCQIFFISEELI